LVVVTGVNHIGASHAGLSPKNQYSHFMVDASNVRTAHAQNHAQIPGLQGAIGVFDSGVGGLSVLRAIRQALPDETLVYVADTGHAPYGDKSSDYIVERTLKVGQWLLERGVRAITVACNTATVVAVRELRQATHVPVVAIEPAIKPAVAVLATQQTVQSDSVAHLIERFAHGSRVLLQACPGWVEQVEKGELDSALTQELLRSHTRPLIQAGADVWVLGCTHFPFLAAGLRQIAGPGVQLIDPADAVARELSRRLNEHPGLVSEVTAGAVASPGADYFFTTGDVEQTSAVISQLWGQPVRVESL
jgi:glutamate racemase